MKSPFLTLLTIYSKKMDNNMSKSFCDEDEEINEIISDIKNYLFSFQMKRIAENNSNFQIYCVRMDFPDSAKDIELISRFTALREKKSF